MSRRRKLSDEERELWDQVRRTADPLHPTRKAEPEDQAEWLPHPVRKAPKKPLEDVPTPPPLEHFTIGMKAKKGKHKLGQHLSPAIEDEVAGAPLNMHKKTHSQMKRGKLMPDARIDLHGMTLAQAHPALVGFVMRNHAAGHRLVLVITGKGKVKETDSPIPERIGALRHQVPMWLQMSPLSHLVLQVRQAHLRHGGGGAYYVYLRRTR
ncbi:Smr/MutS family protein [Donghicola sp.]|jgi:DNA-nicking Smr family endonuclease|uniref:Smr/MutS family protein n=1 Tax=Donghicola sp. TaxID=1929294 RepID=UPI0025E91C7D|nr:Smr/MutS family protein [Donghicola sp.]MCT4576754.1 Smr/MutS family protein [Donghicola sp.]